MEGYQMDYPELKRLRATLLQEINETRVRIRRYSLDPLLQAGSALRGQADEAWQDWLDLRDAFVQLPDTPTAEQLLAIERQWMELDRKVDLIQREVISDGSFRAGIRTLAWIIPTLVALVLIYLAAHGIRGLDPIEFEPWPEWGPLKYLEVAFWSAFGVLCGLAFTASHYMSRRDFDIWYQPWYFSTAVRGPFLTVILMMIVLEFVEWWGEDGGWLETYLLEEGNKYYFIVFTSFILGISSDVTSSIFRDLSDGTIGLIQRIIAGMVRRMNSVLTVVDASEK
jgi:hypothetical protein